MREVVDLKDLGGSAWTDQREGEHVMGAVGVYDVHGASAMPSLNNARGGRRKATPATRKKSAREKLHHERVKTGGAAIRSVCA